MTVDESSHTAMYVERVRTAPRAPWQNAYVERVIGSIRPKCLDHMIVVNGAGLCRALSGYVAYYMRSRRHLALAKESPVPRPVQSPAAWPDVGSTEREAGWTVRRAQPWANNESFAVRRDGAPTCRTITAREPSDSPCLLATKGFLVAFRVNGQ